MVDFTNVMEDSNTDNTSLFGAPYHQTGWNQLLFYANSFESYSSNGTADTTSGTLQLLVTARPGYSINNITIKEFGKYNITNDSPIKNALANSNGFLTVTTLGDVNIVETAHHSEIFSFSSEISGSFSAAWEIDLTNLGFSVSSAVINFNNNLQTSSQIGTSSYIEKKANDEFEPSIALAVNSEPDFQFENPDNIYPTPIPAGMWLFISGLAGLFPIISKSGKK